MNGTSKYTIWHYLGCGCAVLAFLAALAIGGMVWFGYRTAQSFVDPEERQARVKEVLGYEELPEGYYAGFALSIPFVVDLAMIGDQPPPSNGEMESFDDEDLFESRGFMFFRMRRMGDPDDFRSDADYDFDTDRTLGEGTIEAGGATVRYVAKSGTMYAGRSPIRSVASELEIECGDGQARIAVWFERLEAAPDEEDEPAVEEDEAAEDTAPMAEPETPEEPEALDDPEADPAESPLDAADYTGTPADEDALRAFLDHFDLCRR